jgi:hypothetical protein
MWWYWIVDVLMWASGLLLFWKAFERWKGYNKFSFPDFVRKLGCKK